MLKNLYFFEKNEEKAVKRGMNLLNRAFESRKNDISDTFSVANPLART
ncbi:hypothetical protein SAMN05192560_1362 [Methylobacillus rhizosphaerae]|uniref:Uncharacterized protein n=1 Tax=Methylobacillus rhizosphaerae TaxID=551994 RepID=A0A238ZLR9_9PROT|nr:hypothetical protein SAMN05192560_1362 [Methylobacillus rhizosphaerae]